jgi:hypothetical protein
LRYERKGSTGSPAGCRPHSSSAKGRPRNERIAVYASIRGPRCGLPQEMVLTQSAAFVQEQAPVSSLPLSSSRSSSPAKRRTECCSSRGAEASYQPSKTAPPRPQQICFWSAQRCSKHAKALARRGRRRLAA